MRKPKEDAGRNSIRGFKVGKIWKEAKTLTEKGKKRFIDSSGKDNGDDNDN